MITKFSSLDGKNFDSDFWVNGRKLHLIWDKVENNAFVSQSLS
jgi:hypothetical protein